MFKKSKPNFIKIMVEVPRPNVHDPEIDSYDCYSIIVESSEGTIIPDSLVDKIYEDLASKVLRG